MSGKVLSWSKRICSLSVYFKIVLLLLLLLLLHTGTEKGKTAEGKDAAKCGTLRSDAIAEDVHKRNPWTLYRCFAIYLMMSAMCENILLCCLLDYLSICLSKQIYIYWWRFGFAKHIITHFVWVLWETLYFPEQDLFFSHVSCYWKWQHKSAAL